MTTPSIDPGPGAFIVSGVCALVGGSLALVVLAYFDTGPGPLTGPILVGALTIAAVLITRVVPSGPATRSGPPHPVAGPPPFPVGAGTPPGTKSPGPVARPAPASNPQPAAVPATLDIPVGDDAWWTSHQSRPTTDTAGPPPVSAPEPATVSAGETPRQVAQCPQCADFRVDVRHHPPGFDLACTRCGHRWYWQGGTPWPRTIVNPR